MSGQVTGELLLLASRQLAVLLLLTVGFLSTVAAMAWPLLR